jgi:thiol-disulfide isomerase/thioredoxin
MESNTVFTRRSLLLGGSALALSSLLGKLAQSQASPRAGGSPIGVGSKAPELIGGAGDFLNTGGKALRLYGKDGLLSSGAVDAVLIDFWEYTCVNCVRTMPYLKAWNERYRDKAVMIIGIHTPEFDFAKSRQNVADAAKRFGLTYPLLSDAKYANWGAYRNQYWPRKYLIDRSGKIVYDHAGEGGYGETERRIQQLLRAADPKAALPRLLEPLRGADRPGAVCYPQTPEIYAGYGRGADQFGSPEGLKRDADHTYRDVKGKRENGRFYVRGRWRVLPESLRHARATTDPFEDYVALPYKALETNAVIRPEGGKPFDLYLLQDGRPVDRADKGEDVRYTPGGRSFIRVEAPRMYKLIANRTWGEHELRLGTMSPDFGLYSFTFSSCAVGGNS